MTDYEKGYQDALDDVDRAMKESERTTMGPQGIITFNDPAIWIPELKMRYSQRFPKENEKF